MKKKTVLLIVILLLFSAASIFYIYFAYHRLGNTETGQTRTFNRHYMMIVDDAQSAFWQSVYASASEEAESEDAYVELAGSDLSEKHTLEEYLEIGIASKVDGIIVCPDGSDAVKAKIKEATQAGIPVVTILEDDSDSGRVSYVGVNTYEMGQIYGSVILKEASADTNRIYVMQDARENTTYNDMILNQIKMTINEGKWQNAVPEVRSYEIQKDNNFDAEEIIRNMFLNSASAPDILVCLNDADSESASQAAVDYNEVGKVRIIAYYTSDKVMESIKKGIISDTISLDTKNMGTSSVQALKEYIDSGYTSDYISVDLSVVNLDNVDDYIN